MTNGRLEGKVAIVTGGASGIGEACSRIFVREGAKIIISDIDSTKGNALEAELTPDAVFFNHDVTQEAAWDEAVEIAESKWGRLDIVVNNAGMSGPKGRTVVEDVVLDDWNDVFAVNSTAIMLGTRAGIKAMKKVGGGSVINVSSIFGIVGSRAGAPYHASKGAALVFSKAAAVQYGPDNIRVNAVCPGFTDTPMTTDIHGVKEIRDYREGMTPMGRLGLPDDIAYGCLYLASDESAWVTGTELVIDGGETAW